MTFRIRQEEGYRFVASNLGVTTMFKEFSMKVSIVHGFVNHT